MGLNTGGNAVTGVYLGDELLTKGGEVTIKTLAEMAPGPSKLRGGDWNCGYFGVPTTSEMGIITGTGTSADGQPITATTLATAFNVTEGTMQNNDIVWHKFVFKGEIIYITQKPIRGYLLFTTLAEANLIYGEKLLLTNEAKFKISLLKGANDDVTEVKIDESENATAVVEGENSEWDMLLRGISSNPYKINFGPNLTNNDLGVDAGNFNPISFSQSTCCAMRTSSKSILLLGRVGAGTEFYYSDPSENYRSFPDSVVSAIKSKFAWRPALRFTL